MSPSRTFPIGPPAKASGPTCPMQAPVDTPENRASVMSATCFPYDRCFSAAVIWYTSSMPVPRGPPQVRTMMSPALILSSSSRLLIAAIAALSERKTLARPVLRYTPSSSTTVGSIAVLLMTDPSGARLPAGKQTVLVRPRDLALSGSRITLSGSTPVTSRT